MCRNHFTGSSRVPGEAGDFPQAEGQAAEEVV